MAYGESNPYPEHFKYLKVHILDAPFVNITAHFDKCFEFIESAKTNNSKLLIHCHAGMSRSPTICVAYIMKQMGWNLDKSYKHVFSARGFIMPNEGFMKQLVDYEQQLYGTISMKGWVQEEEAREETQQLQPSKRRKCILM